MKAEVRQFILRSLNEVKLSGRGLARVLRVSRTIADLEGCETVMSRHITEAIGYRNLDRSNWGE